MQKKHPNPRKKPSLRRVKRADGSIQIFDVSISGTHVNLVLKKIFSQRKELLHVATVNPEFVMEARRNPRFKTILAQCDVTVADGWGVVRAARILHNTPIDRITGVELVEQILKHAAARGEKVFLLGAQEGVAEKAAKEMKRMHQKLEIAWYEGARTVQVERSEEASMTIAKINAFEPDYLFVAYGSPWQDVWIEDNRPYLRARVAIGIGGVLDEWAGVARRPPQWIDSLHIKWLYRLITQPWRWKRVMRVFSFGFLVLYHKFID